MSQETAEVVRRGIDAFNRRDWDAALKDLAQDFVLDFSRVTGPLQGVFGRDQVRSFWDEFVGAWESVRIEADEFIQASEQVVVPVTGYMRGRDGIEVIARRTWVYTIREGAIVRFCQYQDLQAALEAVGLSEQDAHADS